MADDDHHETTMPKGVEDMSALPSPELMLEQRRDTDRPLTTERLRLLIARRRLGL